MSNTDEVLATWGEVCAWLSEARPDLSTELRPGADAEAVAELTALGLPASWRAWWKANDGAGPVLFDGWSWLPVRGVVDSVLAEYESLIEMAGHLSKESPPSAVGPVLAVWGHREWIPFAVDFSGRLLCIDLAPLSGGVRGQVILVDENERRVLYDGPKSFFADCLMRMEMGVHPDDEPDPDTDEWVAEPAFASSATPVLSEGGEPRDESAEPPRRPVVAEPPKPAQTSAAPEVRADAVLGDEGATALITLSELERSEGATVFVRQTGGDIVGVRVPAGAWSGARLRMTGLGGDGVDLMLVVSSEPEAASPDL